jgi:hypothetical protein
MERKTFDKDRPGEIIEIIVVDEPADVKGFERDFQNVRDRFLRSLTRIEVNARINKTLSTIVAATRDAKRPFYQKLLHLNKTDPISLFSSDDVQACIKKSLANVDGEVGQTGANTNPEMILLSDENPLFKEFCESMVEWFQERLETTEYVWEEKFRELFEILKRDLYDENFPHPEICLKRIAEMLRPCFMKRLIKVISRESYNSLAGLINLAFELGFNFSELEDPELTLKQTHFFKKASRHYLLSAIKNRDPNLEDKLELIMTSRLFTIEDLQQDNISRLILEKLIAVAEQDFGLGEDYQRLANLLSTKPDHAEKYFANIKRFELPQLNTDKVKSMFERTKKYFEGLYNLFIRTGNPCQG